MPSESRRRARRSSSSPSPPPTIRMRTDSQAGKGRRKSRAPVSAVLSAAPVGIAEGKDASGLASVPVTEWSTSYHAGSSSQGIVSSSSSDTDEEWHQIPSERGRSNSTSTVNGSSGSRFLRAPSTSVKRPAHPQHVSSSGASGSDAPNPQNMASTIMQRRTAFTRSRSPVVNLRLDDSMSAATAQAQAQARLSEMIARHQSLKPSHWLPERWSTRLRLPLVGLLTFTVDAKVAAEAFVLLITLGGIRGCLIDAGSGVEDIWIKHEITILMLVSTIHLIWMHSSRAVKVKIQEPNPAPSTPTASRFAERSLRKDKNKGGTLYVPVPKDEFGYVWMTVPKNYRESTDDGIFTVLMLPATIAGALLYIAHRTVPNTSLEETLEPVPPALPLLPADWLIDPPSTLGSLHITPQEALVRSRRQLVNLATLCPLLVLVHVWASWYYEWRKAKRALGLANGAAGAVPAVGSSGGEDIDSLGGSGSEASGSASASATGGPSSGARTVGNKSYEGFGFAFGGGERYSVPRAETRRMKKYALFAFGVSAGVAALQTIFKLSGCGIWGGMTIGETLLAAMAFQLSLYAGIRLAHRGFTLGELGLVCFGGVAVLFETMALTTAHMWPETVPFIKTYRLPTPLLTFQIALIGGSLLCGFILSPLLVLSRHIARRPAKRLAGAAGRKPAEQKLKQQRMLSGSFWGGTTLIIGLIVGLWTRWVLGGRDPWVWAVKWVLKGRRKWVRPAMMAYWAGLGSLSVAGWTRQLARSRRIRPGMAASVGSGTGAGEVAGNMDGGGALGNGAGGLGGVGAHSTDVSGTTTPVLNTGQSGMVSLGMGMAFPPLPSLPLPTLPREAASGFLDAAHERVPTLSLNARRKFFHALAVFMFVPCVAIDPAFTHLAFSGAFALFTFAEYVRYFALYPVGAAVHVFMAEFLDEKDQGAAVLSHFYLLTGCAGALWLEAPSRVLPYTGILILGIGDALASVVGKRLGRYRWSATTQKTMEGSAALVCAVVGCAWLLRVSGLVDPFPIARYTGAVIMASVLEALSVQNDNLTLPLYLWSVLVVAVV